MSAHADTIREALKNVMDEYVSEDEPVCVCVVLHINTDRPRCPSSHSKPS